MAERTTAEVREWARARIDEEYEWGDIDDLLCFADKAGAEIIRLADIIDAQAERIARLVRVLAVERGDESAAPEGWRCTNEMTRRWHQAIGDREWEIFAEWTGEKYRWRLMARAGFAWRELANGRCPTALEAMEAADDAMEVAP